VKFDEVRVVPPPFVTPIRPVLMLAVVGTTAVI